MINRILPSFCKTKFSAEGAFESDGLHTIEDYQVDEKEQMMDESLYQILKESGSNADC